MSWRNLITTAFLLAVLFLGPAPGRAADPAWVSQVKQLARGGGVMVVDPAGEPLLELNPDQAYMPASTLKVVTMDAALSLLTPDYRFTTNFYLSESGDLFVVGRGDPYLISEELEVIAAELVEKGLRRVRNIYLDNSFFEPGLVLHGTSRSLRPYDAYNGALCVNFNTIYVQVSAGGRVVSAEPQTPLTDYARDLALKIGLRGKARINLAENPRTCLLYAGSLLKEFLVRAGVEVEGEFLPGKAEPDKLRLLYSRQSTKDLAWLARELLKYSNNYMTNQVFLTLGAELYGPPADVEKARRAVAEFLAANNLPSFHIEEGSGLSRRTTVTPRQMIAILRHFERFRDLLVSGGASLYKTGTLRDVNAMVGYIIRDDGSGLPFAILINGRVAYGTRDRILDLLEKNLR